MNIKPQPVLPARPVSATDAASRPRLRAAAPRAPLARNAARCLIRSLDFSSRASRREYWCFLPVGIALPVLAALLARLSGMSPLFATTFAVPALLPLAAVTARRLADSGARPSGVLAPSMDLAGLFLSCVALEAAHDAFVPFLNASDGPAGAAIHAGYLLVMAFAGLLALRFLISGLITGLPLVSQMAEPSRPGPNRFGPNPIEVTQ